MRSISRLTRSGSQIRTSASGDAALSGARRPEVPAVLRQLRDVGFATAILSNGSPAMLTAAVDHVGFGAIRR